MSIKSKPFRIHPGSGGLVGRAQKLVQKTATTAVGARAGGPPVDLCAILVFGGEGGGNTFECLEDGPQIEAGGSGAGISNIFFGADPTAPAGEKFDDYADGALAEGPIGPTVTGLDDYFLS